MSQGRRFLLVDNRATYRYELVLFRDHCQPQVIVEVAQFDLAFDQGYWGPFMRVASSFGADAVVAALSDPVVWKQQAGAVLL